VTGPAMDPSAPLAAISDSTMAAGSMVILVAGYVAVFALWFFVFRKGGEDDGPPSS